MSPAPREGRIESLKLVLLDGNTAGVLLLGLAPGLSYLGPRAGRDGNGPGNAGKHGPVAVAEIRPDTDHKVGQHIEDGRAANPDGERARGPVAATPGKCADGDADEQPRSYTEQRRRLERIMHRDEPRKGEPVGKLCL